MRDSPSDASTGEESTTSTGSSDPPPPLISSELEDKFTVVVDGDVIVLDDVTKQVLARLIKSTWMSAYCEIQLAEQAQ